MKWFAIAWLVFAEWTKVFSDDQSAAGTEKCTACDDLEGGWLSDIGQCSLKVT